MSKHYVAQPDHGCAWVTGASSGIGRELALAFAKSGWTVAVTARSEDALASLRDAAASSAGRIVPLAGDVSDNELMAAHAQTIAETLGPVSLLVANAGVYYPQDGLEGDLAQWHASFAVNLNGTVNVLLPVISQMKAAGRGQVAIVASVAGYSGLPTSAAYGATKAGLINMAESLKFDLDRAGIRIQIVNPGFVDTPATKSNPFPMPHLMSPEDAVSAILKGLAHPSKFEIAFPGPFVRQLKLLRLLPYRLYFPLVARATGWAKKGPA